MKNLKVKNSELSSHQTIGINVFSIMTGVMLNAHVWGQLTWWALPITVVFAIIAFNNEIQPRKQTNNINLH